MLHLVYNDAFEFTFANWAIHLKLGPVQGITM